MAHQSNPSPKLISILLASIRPQNLSQLLFSLTETCDDPTRVEVWVKIDDGDDAMREYLDMAVDTYPISVRYLQTPKEDGYYTLHHGYQQLYKASDPSSYFIVIVNDEVRFVTKGWDSILSKYVGFFPDDVFRLKISQQKLRNYYSVYECGPCPDNYPITTRKWMELAEGVGDCWGPDVWHQMIDYHLGLASSPNADLFRSVPIHTIRIENEEAGRQLSYEAAQKRWDRICQEWWRMASVEKQQEVRRLAVKIQAYLWAKIQNLEAFYILDNHKNKVLEIHREDAPQALSVFPYHLSSSYVRLHRFTLLMRCFRGTLGDVRATLYAYIVGNNEPELWALKYGRRTVNFCIVVVAFICSLFWPHFDSRTRSWRREILLRLNNYAYLAQYTFCERRKGLDWVRADSKSFKGSYEKRYLSLLALDPKSRMTAQYTTIYQSDVDMNTKSTKTAA